jgi:hypothetical protein
MFNLQWSALAASFGFVLSLLIGLVSGAGVSAFIRALVFGGAFFVLGSFLYWLAGRFLPELMDSSGDGYHGFDTGSQVDISLDDDDSSLEGSRRGASGDAFGGMGDSLGGALGSSMGDAIGEAYGGALGIEGLENLSKPMGGSSFEPAGIGELGGGGFSPGGTALDQNSENGYTENGNAGGGSEPAKELASRQERAEVAREAGAIPSESSDALDMLPELDAMSQVFIPSSFAEGGMPKDEGGTPVSVAFPRVERNSYTSEEAEEFRGKEKASAMAIQTILKRD